MRDSSPWPADSGRSLPKSVEYRSNVSTEPLADIEAQVCNAGDSLAASRFRRLFNEIMQLRSALGNVLSAMETVAWSSFASAAGTFEADWKAEDPEGYASWWKARNVLGDRSQPREPAGRSAAVSARRAHPQH